MPSSLGTLLLLARALPSSPARLLCRSVVLLYLLLHPGYRAEIRRNARLVLGRDRPFFWLANAWRLGANIALMARPGRGADAAIVDTAAIYGDNISCRCLEQELHIAMVSIHFGMWESLPAVFARRGYAVSVMTGRQRDMTVGLQLDRIRRKRGVRMASGTRSAVATIRRPGMSGFMMDNTSQGRQEWADEGVCGFRMPALPFELAERHGIKLLPAVAWMERGRLKVEVGRPGDRNSAARFFLDRVRARPEEWIFWGKAGALR